MNRRIFLMKAGLTAVIIPCSVEAKPCPSEIVDTIDDKLNELGADFSRDAIKRGLAIGGVAAVGLAFPATAAASGVVLAGLSVITAAPIIMKKATNAVAIFESTAKEVIDGS